MTHQGKKVLIAGGTGLIGSRLTSILADRGAEVVLLSRESGKYNGFKAFEWQPSKHQMDESALEGVDFVINLAGAGIADKRWTKSRKQIIIDSRVNAAITFEKYLDKLQDKPSAYLSASAVGYYGDRGKEILTEQSDQGEGFLAETTAQWEKAADRINKIIPVKKLRMGVVLSTKGGALPQLAGPQRFGIGTLMGSGQQYYPWIHIDDVCGIFNFLLERDDLQGVFNGVSPNPVKQTQLVEAIKKGMNRPAVKLPAPGFILRTVLGEMASVVLNSNRVIPQRLNDEGYQFLFDDLEKALKDLSMRKI